MLVGGTSHRRSASERFRYRLDVLLNLRDVELALEEYRTQVWYMAVCAECHDLPPVRYERDSERAEWSRDHTDITGHVVVRFEEPR